MKRKLVKLPRIIILHLKRYQVQNKNANHSSTEWGQKSTKKKNNNTLNKNGSYVNVPRFLTLKFLTAEKRVLQLPKPIPLNLYNPVRVMNPNQADDRLNLDEVVQVGKTRSHCKGISSDIKECEKVEPLVQRSEADRKLIEFNSTVSSFFYVKFLFLACFILIFLFKDG